MQEESDTEEYVLIEEEKTSWQERLEKFLENRYFIISVFILMSVISFCLGRVSGLEEGREPVRIINTNNPPYIKGGTGMDTANGEVKGVSTSSADEVVASKNGTKYHYLWCAGAKQISEKNKIIFPSIEAARAAGYTPASNCKGLK